MMMTPFPPQFGNQFGNKPAEARQEVAQRQAVREKAVVQKQQAKRVAHQVAHAPIPQFDRITGRYTPALAQHYAETQYGVSRPKTDTTSPQQPFSGEALLQCLTSTAPYSLYAQPAIEGLSRYEIQQHGLPEAALHQFAQDHGQPQWVVYEALQEGKRQGLVYEIRDTQRGATYYGTTLEVVRALNLAPPQPPADGVNPIERVFKTLQVKATPLFEETLGKVLGWVAKHTEDGELLEYGGQLTRALEQKQLVKADDVPEVVQHSSEHTSDERIDGTLLNLLEISRDGDGFGLVKNLCGSAMDMGLLDPQAYQAMI